MDEFSEEKIEEDISQTDGDILHIVYYKRKKLLQFRGNDMAATTANILGVLIMLNIFISRKNK